MVGTDGHFKTLIKGICFEDTSDDRAVGRVDAEFVSRSI
jgi:hypothetical protein